MVATRRKRSSFGLSADGLGAANKSLHKRQGIEELHANSADAQGSIPTPADTAVYHHGRAITVCNDAQTVDAWIQAQVSDLGGQELVPVGFDCEWSPPWHRGEAEEKVGVVQLATEAACLVVQVQAMDSLPRSLADLLAASNCLKIGVNVRGDLNRLVRDFGVAFAGAHDLAELAHSITSGRKPRSLEDLAKNVLRVQMGSKTGGPRMSDWAKWPLDECQVEYAAGDAAIAYDIYVKGPKALRAHNPDKGCSATEAADELPSSEAEAKKQEGKGSSAVKSNFFQMMRNKSIEPPMKGRKTYPQGGKAVLEGYCFIVSGVLDSMDRAECSNYIQQHGGRVIKSFTKQVTHVLNDHGEIGPSKLKKARAANTPIVGEDFVLKLVDPAWLNAQDSM